MQLWGNAIRCRFHPAVSAWGWREARRCCWGGERGVEAVVPWGVASLRPPSPVSWRTV